MFDETKISSAKEENLIELLITGKKTFENKIVNVAYERNQHFNWSKLTFNNCLLKGVCGLNLQHSAFIDCCFNYSISQCNLNQGNLFEECTFKSCGHYNEDFVNNTYFKCVFENKYFRRCNFLDVSFEECDLSKVTFNQSSFVGDCIAKNSKLPESTLPETGDLIGYKRLGRSIAKLLIKDGVKRVMGLGGGKCRAESAEVISLEDILTGEPIKEDVSLVTFFPDISTDAKIYREGEEVKASSYEDCRLPECTHGIHFFLTRSEALGFYPLKRLEVNHG